MSDAPTIPAPKPIPGLPARISVWLRHSTVILLAWISGLPVAAEFVLENCADALGVPEIKQQVDALVSAHPNFVKAYGIALPLLFWWARTRTAKKTR